MIKGRACHYCYWFVVVIEVEGRATRAKLIFLSHLVGVIAAAYKAADLISLRGSFSLRPSVHSKKPQKQQRLRLSVARRRRRRSRQSTGDAVLQIVRLHWPAHLSGKFYLSRSFVRSVQWIDGWMDDGSGGSLER